MAPLGGRSHASLPALRLAAGQPGWPAAESRRRPAAARQPTTPSLPHLALRPWRQYVWHYPAPPVMTNEPSLPAQLEAYQVRACSLGLGGPLQGCDALLPAPGLAAQPAG